MIVLPWPHKSLWPNVMAEARRLYAYEPLTGNFVRIVRAGQKGHVGEIAGGICPQGYVRLRIFGKRFAAHRVAWAWMNGDAEPPAMIDHINGDRADNRAANLRVVDNSTNLENMRKARADNSLGVLGVRQRPNGKFEARICVKGWPVQIGTYATLDEAAAAYLGAKRALHAGCTL